MIGGLFAVVFHEFVYKKVSETIKESEEAEGFLDNNEEEEQHQIMYGKQEEWSQWWIEQASHKVWMCVYCIDIDH